MQAKAKKNSVVTHAVMEDGRIQFTVLGAGEFTFDPSKAAEQHRRRAEQHGWIQRISDRAAIARDLETNLPATPAEKKARMAELAQHYESGSADWNLKGGGGGAGSITIEAIARIKSVSYEVAEGFVEEYAEKKFGGDTKKCLAELRSGAKVQEAMAAIRKERTPAPKADADGLLDELGAQ